MDTSCESLNTVWVEDKKIGAEPPNPCRSSIGGAARHLTHKLPGEHCSQANMGSANNNTSSATGGGGRYKVQCTHYAHSIQAFCQKQPIADVSKISDIQELEDV